MSFTDGQKTVVEVAAVVGAVLAGLGAIWSGYLTRSAILETRSQVQETVKTTLYSQVYRDRIFSCRVFISTLSDMLSDYSTLSMDPETGQFEFVFLDQYFDEARFSEGGKFAEKLIGLEKAIEEFEFWNPEYIGSHELADPSALHGGQLRQFIWELRNSSAVGHPSLFSEMINQIQQDVGAHCRVLREQMIVQQERV